MADSATFCWVCEEIERVTRLSRLEARGTVRLALKEAGLEPRSVNAEQMKTILKKVMPAELASRGIEEAASLCGGIARALESAGLGGAASSAETPEEIFRRLGARG
jgi:hypothetical protein